jgi:hypothetical protein
LSYVIVARSWRYSSSVILEDMFRTIWILLDFRFVCIDPGFAPTEERDEG